MKKEKAIPSAQREIYGFFIGLVFLLIACPSQVACSKREPIRTSDLPNVILIVLDTFRADHIGLYGNDWINTPNMDAFAREAVVFERASSASTWTLPSLTSLFTGLLPNEHGVLGGKYSQVSPDHVMMAEFLRNNGFSTKAFVAHDYLTEDFGMAQGFDNLEAYLDGPVSGRIESYEEEVLSYLSDPPGFPYFLMVHYFDAHPPYLPPEPFDEMYYSGDPSRQEENSLAVIYGDENRVSNKADSIYKWLKDVTDIEYPIKQYAAGVSHVDHHVGILLDCLRCSGELERSIVIITADHGEHLTEHNVYFSHRYPYEENLHIPLIIRLPKAIHGGRRVKEEVSNIDILPTLADLLELSLPRKCNGLSLVPLMAGKTDRVKSRLLFAEFGTPGQYTRAVWNDRFRLVRSDVGKSRRIRYELFDHKVDLSEARNVTQEYPEILEALKLALRKRFARNKNPGNAVGPGRETDLSAEVLNRLEQLGYSH